MHSTCLCGMPARICLYNRCVHLKLRIPAKAELSRDDVTSHSASQSRSIRLSSGKQNISSKYCIPLQKDLIFLMAFLIMTDKLNLKYIIINIKKDSTSWMEVLSYIICSFYYRAELTSSSLGNTAEFCN